MLSVFRPTFEVVKAGQILKKIKNYNPRSWVFFIFSLLFAGAITKTKWLTDF